MVVDNCQPCPIQATLPSFEHLQEEGNPSHIQQPPLATRELPMTISANPPIEEHESNDSKCTVIEIAKLDEEDPMGTIQRYIQDLDPTVVVM
ncbi:hypothetical protein SUGI_1205160 [Cryptomeria japonica]|nr:hypothetical protein SUGI_1205160 [Cryptomeria japonica]